MSDPIATPAADTRRLDRASRHSRFLAQSIVLEESGVSRLVRTVMAMVCLVVLAFVGWTAVTEVKEVAVTHGEVVPSGSVRVVQHLEGGIVSEILVEEGQLVEAGSPLMRLEATGAAADLDQLETRRAALALRIERLRALGTDREPDFSAVDAAYEPLARDQQAIWRGDVASHAAGRSVILSQIEQRRAELQVIERQQSSIKEQIAIFDEEIDIQRRLVEQGLDSRMSYLKTQREKAALLGEQQRMLSELTATGKALAEAESRLVELDTGMRQDALDEMGLASAEFAEVEETINRVGDMVTRLDVRAPVRGLVQDLQVRTVGAVVAPGGVLMQLVPIDDVLRVETRVSTTDVGHVRVGQPVSVKVATFDFARYGDIDGILHSISPTTLLDEEQEPYYKALVTLATNHVGTLPGRNLVLPGMTVQADVVTGEKTILQYLLKPIYVSVEGALRER
jgi:HlyD family secretion protein/adhesin transport system membrane fusion protein